VQDSYAATPKLHALAPHLQIWECDYIVYRAGWLQEGIVTPAQLGGNHYMNETPTNRRVRKYWDLIKAGEITEAIAWSKESGIDALAGSVGRWTTEYPGRPEYFSHWGAAFRHMAVQVGLPVGDYPESRPPQAVLPQAARDQITAAYAKFGPNALVSA
jgi:4-hydroxy-tetrahydrodipicolinate synthase